MKKLMLLLLTTTFVVSGYSQHPIEKLFVRSYIPCEDVIYNSTLLVPEYFKAEKCDTLRAILDYWESHCGMSEPLLRVKILLAIKGDSLTEDIYHGIPIINYIDYFKQRNDTSKRAAMLYDYRGFHGVIHPDFDKFTYDLAQTLKSKKDLTHLERFFTDLYALNHKNIFYSLQDSTLAGTTLKSDYNHLVNRFIKQPEGHFNVYSGVWVPQGNLSIVGLHPVIGLTGGVKIRKVLLDLAVEFKFGDSPNNYLVKKADSIYTTNYFFGGYIGGDIGYELFQYKAHELDIVAGIGFDGFDVLNIGDPGDADEVSKSLNTLNINMGLGYRFYLKNKSYLGLEGRYNIVDYKNENGTDLSGNVLTLRLKYGISRNLLRDRNLYKLEHKSLNEYPPKYLKWLNSNQYSSNFWYW